MKESIMMANYMAEKEIAESRGFTAPNDAFEISGEQQLQIRSIDGLFAAFADHDTEDWMRYMVDEDKLAEFARSYAILKEVGPFESKYKGGDKDYEPLKECRKLADELKKDIRGFLKETNNLYLDPDAWEKEFESDDGFLADREVDFLLRHMNKWLEYDDEHSGVLTDIVRDHRIEMKENHTASICNGLKKDWDEIRNLITNCSSAQLSINPEAEKLVGKLFAPDGPGTRVEKILEKCGSDTYIYKDLIKLKKCDEPVRGLKEFRDQLLGLRLHASNLIYRYEIKEIIFNIYKPNIETPIKQRIAEYVVSKDKTVPVMANEAPVTVHGVPVKIAVEPVKEGTYRIEDLVATAKAQADALAETLKALDVVKDKKGHDDRLI